MYLINAQQINSLTLLALFSTAAIATPIIDSTEPNLQTRGGETLRFSYWTETDFHGSSFYTWEETPGFGGCYNFGNPNQARSARAPNGFKCTIYSDANCDGWRTREFSSKFGISNMGDKMNANGASWRCCRIGTTNDWGYCENKLNVGTFS